MRISTCAQGGPAGFGESHGSSGRTMFTGLRLKMQQLQVCQGLHGRNLSTTLVFLLLPLKGILWTGTNSY